MAILETSEQALEGHAIRDVWGVRIATAPRFAVVRHRAIPQIPRGPGH